MVKDYNKRKQELFDALGIVTTHLNNAREMLAFFEKRQKNILDELDAIKNHRPIRYARNQGFNK